VINQIRELLLERGITFRKGRRHAEASLPAVLEDADNGLSGLLRVLLTQLRGELRQLQNQINEADANGSRRQQENSNSAVVSWPSLALAP
jgi:transposase